MEEIFEARVPKGRAILAEIEGTAHIETAEDGGRKIAIVNSELFTESYPIPANYIATVKEGDDVAEGQVIAESNVEGGEGRVLATIGGKVGFDVVDGVETIIVRDEQTQEKRYDVLANAQILGAQARERDQHGDERQAVEQERPPHAHRCDHHARHSRADHARGVVRGGVERDGVGQVAVGDEFGDEGLAHRRI